MSGRIGLGRLLLRYLVAMRGVLGLVAAVVAALAFVVSVAPAALESFLTDTQRHSVEAAAPGSLDLVTEQRLSPPPAVVDDDWALLRDRLAQAREEMPARLREFAAPAMFTVTVAPRQVAGAPPGAPQLPNSVLNLSASPDLQPHVTLREGTLPRAATDAGSTAEIVLSRETAEEMRWPVGEARGLAAPGQPERRYRLSGTYEARDPDGPFWRQTSGAVGPVITDDGKTRTVTATAWVSAENLDALAPVGPSDTRLTLWYPLAPQSLTSADAAPVIDELSELTRTSVEVIPEYEVVLDGMGIQRVPAARASFSTQLTGLLRETQVTAGSLTSLTALLASGPAAAALCVLVLATGLVRARSGTLLVLTRARGASRGQVACAAAVVGLLVGIPAAALGAGVAAAVAPPYGTPPWWLVACCGLLPVVTAVLAATDNGPRRVPRWAVELAVVALAVAALVAVAQRGLGDPTAGLDPFLVAAPVLVCLAGAVLARRLLPVVARRVAAVQRRRTGLVGLLGASRSRADRVSPAAVVALVAALGVTTFAGCVVATLDAGRASTATATAGADLRVSGTSLDAAAVDSLAALPGVRATAPLGDGARVDVATVSSTYATRVLADASALAEAQGDGAGSLPGLSRLSSREDDRVPVIVSPDVAEALGGERDIEVDGVESRVVGVGPGVLPGVPVRQWLLADPAALGDDAPSYAPVVSVLVGLDDPASPSLVRRVEEQFPGAAVTTPQHEARVLDADPVVSGVRAVAWSAAAGSAVLVAATVVLALIAGAGSRTRDLAVVRALGLPLRRASGLPLWEVGLLVAVAGAVGLAVGAALPLTVLEAVDLRPFTSGDDQPATTFPLLWGVGVVACMAVVTVLGALLAALGPSRRELTTALRMMEE
ncbi:ABC transporter permease [Mumia quercus]|uniref:ABC transporter permease n=1 Tax=Mumia quercus TaxID=2976125 RepID=UPI0021D16521|nr:FtsX-like permease family protein [Mumia quercus]